MASDGLEKLQVFQRSLRFMTTVFAVTPRFGRDAWLADQLNASVESVLSNITEGYGQLTDRGFARYLAMATGSLQECRGHLAAARERGHVSVESCAQLSQEALEISRMLRALISYLRRSDRKDRFG